MKTYFYYRNEKITKKEAIRILGQKKFEERLADAKRNFMEDPYELNEWVDGFRIEFV